MSEDKREQISALMDDELTPEQTRQLLASMKKDAQLRQFWQSSQLISAAVRGESVAKGAPELADRVRDALANEPTLLAPSRPTKRPSLGPLGGLAIAASVAMIAIIATQQAFVDRQELSPQAIAKISPAPENSTQLASSNVIAAKNQSQLDEDQDVALTRMTWNEAGPAVEARLNAYLLNHNEYMVGGLHGMLPYARVVGYDQTK